MKRNIVLGLFIIFATALIAQLPNNQLRFSVGPSIQGSGDYKGLHLHNDFTRKIRKNIVIGIGLGIDHASGPGFFLDTTKRYTIGGYGEKTLGANVQQFSDLSELKKFSTHTNQAIYIIGDLNIGYINEFGKERIKIMAGPSIGFVNKVTVAAVYPYSTFFEQPINPNYDNTIIVVPVFQRFMNIGWNLKLEYDHYFNEKFSVGARLGVQDLRGDIISSVGISDGVSF